MFNALGKLPYITGDIESNFTIKAIDQITLHFEI